MYEKAIEDLTEAEIDSVILMIHIKLRCLLQTFSDSEIIRFRENEKRKGRLSAVQIAERELSQRSAQCEAACLAYVAYVHVGHKTLQ